MCVHVYIVTIVTAYTHNSQHIFFFVDFVERSLNSAVVDVVAVVAAVAVAVVVVAGAPRHSA